VPFEALQDPYGKAFWPEFKGRDGCRTPMPWQRDAVQGGFSSAEPWLPMSPAHLPLAVDVQEDDPDSLLHATRALLAWRRQHPALRGGEMRFLPAPDGVLHFERSTATDRLELAFNLSDEAETIEPFGLIPAWGWASTTESTL
jgi:alpha-glucosidase